MGQDRLEAYLLSSPCLLTPKTTSRVRKIIGQALESTFRVLARIVIAGNGRRIYLEI
jgi:hypothetical protein